jgi:hypothetical protein
MTWRDRLAAGANLELCGTAHFAGADLETFRNRQVLSR